MSSRDAFTAIADATRREILTILRDGGALPAGGISERFPSVSRPGISRHLRILRECGVVTARRSGKHQHYSLTAGPLRDVADGWLAGFAAKQVQSLADLRYRVERSEQPKED